ncbi:hypothetical protein C8F04DRAFT_1396522 [Mycena alexandri]|uniref:Uncharacterized protein n=1 Tax=Mycena alexandri TaxID=1745969 RepID=A0AAD6SVT6_9AGAR|nr:hypothetical protein C8F04DRAFT_1396522 [Mycena alexandri]
MGFEHFRMGKAGAAFRHNPGTTKTKRAAGAADPSCKTGAFYSAPALGSTVDSLTPLNVTWDPTLNCLPGSPSLVDILLYAPGSVTPVMHTWSGVPYAAGAYTVSLLPKWWNATAYCNLQLMVLPASTPAFLSTIPAGPVFNATYTAPATGIPPAADLTQGSNNGGMTVVGGVSTHSLSPGKKAAAVILPLLFVLLLGLAYLKISRAKGAAKRSAWSEKLDKRMSTISQDWKAITPGGAKEAVRQSIAHSRNSVFAFGAIQPGAVEGEPVVMGEKATVRGGSIEISEKDLPRTSLGSGVGVGVGARRPRTHATPPDRTSRAVSFADAAHPRPSVSSAYSRGSRAFHTASTYNDFADGEDLPPVPALPSPSRISAYGDRGISTYSTAPSTYSAGSTNNNTGHGQGQGQSVYANASAWSSGERVEGVDGGYGAQSVSPTGRVHTINYPEAPAYNAAYDDGTANAASYFSPTTPTPHSGFPDTMGAYEPSADSAYAANTFGAPAYNYGSAYGSPVLSASGSGSESGGVSAFTSPRQTAGPLTLTPDDIRRRMTRTGSSPNAHAHAHASPHANNRNSGFVGQMGQGQGGEGGEWRQSVDEVFGALSWGDDGVLRGGWAGLARASRHCVAARVWVGSRYRGSWFVVVYGVVLDVAVRRRRRRRGASETVSWSSRCARRWRWRCARGIEASSCRCFAAEMSLLLDVRRPRRVASSSTSAPFRGAVVAVSVSMSISGAPDG